VPEGHVRQYHLDNIVRLLAPNSTVIEVRGETRGAACTALLAAEMIDNGEELLVVNGNELIDADFEAVVKDFRKRKLDAGAITFSSVHPRYSYVKLDKDGFVVEAAEKRPISQNATAGFYWYAQGKTLVAALKGMIRKDAAVNGNYYICPAFNEVVLAQGKVGTYSIGAKQYHPLKSERQIDLYEREARA
jgi:dTDP-glucose pyrophosphorylase